MTNLNVLEVANKINESATNLENALKKVYRNKVFVVLKGDQIWSFEKTKRGATGYINKHDNYYYDDTTFEMKNFSNGMYIVEVPATKLVDINTDIQVWYNEAKDFQKYEYSMNTLLNKITRFNLSEEVKNMINNYVSFIEENGYHIIPSIIDVAPEFKEETKINNEITTIDTVKVAPVENVTMELNEEKNGVELYFSSIPTTQTRTQLKENGFRWSKFKKCWYAKQKDQTIQFAKELTNTVDTVEVEEVAPETTVQEKNTTNNINDEIETLKTENDVIKSAIEEVEEQTEMSTLYDQDGKIEVNHIIINWSESAYLKDNSKYFTWKELDNAIYKASCHAPNNGAYDKTSYTVVWTDGTEYSGRLDLQYKDSYKTNIIPNAIHDFLAFRNGTNKPAHMTQQEYSLHMEQDSEKLKQIERYLNDLSYSDSEPVTPPEKPTNETNSNVINLFDHKRNNEQTKTKEAVKTLVNASNSVIDFTNIRVRKEEEKETQKQLDAFFNDIYPLMTRDDIETLVSMRNATNEEIAHELARITTRIELQKKLKKQ